MLDHAAGVAGQHIVDGEAVWKVPSWTLGALGALRDCVFQRALRSTYGDGLPDEAQARDRAVLRRLYAIGLQFDPYRLIFDGALDDDENLTVFLHNLLLKNYNEMTEAATRELVRKNRDQCVLAVLNANPRMSPPSPPAAGKATAKATVPVETLPQPTNGQPSSEA